MAQHFFSLTNYCLKSTFLFHTMFTFVSHVCYVHAQALLESDKISWGNRVLPSTDLIPGNYVHDFFCVELFWHGQIFIPYFQVSRASRKYILAQGPLPTTVGHFWLTVWQRKSKAILMLNRVIERHQPKCHQYWPLNEGEVMDLPDVHLSLTHYESKPGQHYTVRTLK